MSLWKTLIAAAVILMAGSAFAQTGYWSEPVPVENLNTTGNEIYTYLSADGNILLWNADGQICISHRNGTAWGEKIILPEAINDPVGLERAMAITPDHSQIYWVSWRTGGWGGWDIWRCNWNESTNTCGAAECLGENVNSYADEFGIYFTLDGSRMYFDSNVYVKNGQYGYGDDDIWYCNWDSIRGDWGLAYNIGPPVNSPGPEFSPFISNSDSTTGKRLYFSSWGGHYVPGWQGDCDIYYATWDGSHWTNVTNAYIPINSPAYDASACISPAGGELYFTCNRYRQLNNDLQIWVSTIDTTSIADDSSYENKDSLQIITYPNPTNMTCKIMVSNLKSDSSYRFLIYDLLGREVRDLGGFRNRTGISTTWDGTTNTGSKVASGGYILNVKGGAKLLAVKKIFMLK
jgi:hypothetical protein